MFDLNHSLNEWRQSLREGGECLEEDIAELEGHLREETTSLEKLGLSNEEAFLLAARRLGGADSLKQEFEKVNAITIWMTRLRWMGLGVLVYLLGASFSVALYQGVVAALAYVGLRGYWVGAFCFDLTGGLLVAAGYLLYRAASKSELREQFPALLEKRSVRAGLLFGILAWTVALFGCSNQLIIFTFNLVGASDYNRIAVVTSFGSFVLTVVLPVILAFWIMRSSFTRRPAESR